jgi:hypothetical protein
VKNLLILFEVLTALSAALCVYYHADTGAFLFIIAAIGINCLALVWPQSGFSAGKKPDPKDFVVKFRQPTGK